MNARHPSLAALGGLTALIGALALATPVAAQTIKPFFASYGNLTGSLTSTTWSGTIGVWCPGTPPTLVWSCNISVTIPAGAGPCDICETLANAINGNAACMGIAVTAVCNGPSLKIFTDATNPCPGAYISFDTIVSHKMAPSHLFDSRVYALDRPRYWKLIKAPSPPPATSPNDWIGVMIHRIDADSVRDFSASVLPDANMPAAEVLARLLVQLRSQGDSVTTVSGDGMTFAPGTGTYDVQIQPSDPRFGFAFSTSPSPCSLPGADCTTTSPPDLWRAYPRPGGVVRVVFSEAVTAASATNVANYSLASFGTVDSATLPSANIVDLHVTTDLNSGDPEQLTVNGLVAASSGIAQTTPQAQPFVTGVLSVAQVRAPDPGALAGVPCRDRSAFAGTDTLPGPLVSVQGVCTAAFGRLAFIEDPTGAPRSGLAVVELPYPMQAGHKYVVTGRVREEEGCTELADVAAVTDLGTAPSPAALEVSLHAVASRACDATQSTLEGKDLEGVLVRVSRVRVLNSGAAPAGFVIASAPFGDTTLVIAEPGGYTVNPDSTHFANITGVVRTFAGKSLLLPRGDTDIADGGVASVGGGSAAAVRFEVGPNPSRALRAAFTLPSASEVRLEIFDLLGRRVATLANGTLAAGDHAFGWDGRRPNGSPSQAGMYYCQLRVNNLVFARKVVHLVR